MSTVVKDLGAVSAYAYAVEKGYTGTEAEFAELMADYAEVGQRAEDAAESALNSKTAAQTAATTATNKATEATTAAQTATTKAGEAQTSAQTASSKASEASQSASQASRYAQTAETAKTDAQTAKTQADTARDEAVTAKTAAETAQGKAEDAQAAAESVAESIPSDYSQLSEDVSDLKEDLTTKADLDELYKAFPTDTATGAVTSFNDGANVPVKSLIVNIDPVQSGSGDTSPTNVRPISGWSEVNVGVSGKNLLDADSTLASYKQSDGSYRIPSNVIPTTKFYFPSSLVGKQVTISAEFKSTDITNMRVCAVINNVFTNGTYVNGTTFAQSKVTVVPMSTEDYIRFDYGRNGGGGLGVKDFQVEFGDVVTAYEPYNSLTSINIQLGQTVYGGTLDVTKGELVIDRAGVDLGTLTWQYQSAQNRFYAKFSADALFLVNDTVRPDIICSAYKNIPFRTLTNGSDNNVISAIKTVYNYITVRDTAYNDAATFMTAMSGVQLVYGLATPVTVTLTPHEVTALLGSNNIWADSGDTEVEYRADTRLYIEKLTQPEEDDMVADSAITSGKFFMIGNSLYRALANIASGATITVGTNAQRVSLSDALNLVNT